MKKPYPPKKPLDKITHTMIYTNSGYVEESDYRRRLQEANEMANKYPDNEEYDMDIWWDDHGAITSNWQVSFNPIEVIEICKKAGCPESRLDTIHCVAEKDEWEYWKGTVSFSTLLSKEEVEAANKKYEVSLQKYEDDLIKYEQWLAQAKLDRVEAKKEQLRKELERLENL